MKTTIVKIGGTVLENPAQRTAFLTAFKAIEGRKILVHGGGKTTSNWAKKLGVDSNFIDGRRVTSAELLEIATLVYSGINKQLVAGLQHLGINAIGLSGADGKLIPAKKRSIHPIDYGWVGDPVFDSELAPLLRNLLMDGMCPVVSALSYDVDSGNLLNTNADSITLFLSKVLQEMGEVAVIYAFEFGGVLRDVSDENSVIATLSEEEISILSDQGVIHSGMLPKLDCGINALKLGAQSVQICQFDKLHSGTKLVIQ